MKVHCSNCVDKVEIDEYNLVGVVCSKCFTTAAARAGRTAERILIVEKLRRDVDAYRSNAAHWRERGVYASAQIRDDYATMLEARIEEIKKMPYDKE